MIRLTRDILRSWFPRDAVFSKTQLEDVLGTIVKEFKNDFCLQEIVDVTFKLYMEDVAHFNINYPFYSLFCEITSRFDLNLYELTEQCVLYNMPDIRYVQNKYDRLQITISKVVRFYGEHANSSFLEKVLYDTCKKELGLFYGCSFKSDFESIFKSTVKFFLNY